MVGSIMLTTCLQPMHSPQNGMLPERLQDLIPEVGNAQ